MGVQVPRGEPADLAFLAMSEHLLGHVKEAQAYLQHLQDQMKDPHWEKDPAAKGFLREAESLLATPRTPR
jgi:hypothetical protein